MSIAEIGSIIIAVLFGSIAVAVSFKEDKTQKLLKEKKRSQEQKAFEASIMSAIQEKIGYSFTIEDITDIITGSVKSLLPYSTASSMLLTPDTILFKTYADEQVGEMFLEKVKSTMLASLISLHSQIDTRSITHAHLGIPVDKNMHDVPNSFFHIPLMSKGKVLGLINIASKKVGLYKQDEIRILYQLSNNALEVLARLHDALTIEKDKLMAMIGSLADGVFMVNVDKKLLVVNETAKTLLGIQSKNPNIIDLLSAFPNEYRVNDLIDQAIHEKKSVEEKEITLAGKVLQLYLTPVVSSLDDGLSPDSPHKKGIIGVSILLHDITLEKAVLQMKEDFTNMVVHELRAPLAAIKDASELIITTSDKLDSEEQKNLLAIIHRQSARMLDEVSSILDAAKLEAGRFAIQKSTSDIKKVIQEKLEIFLPQAVSKRISLATHVDDTIPAFFFDQKRIGQVITNLLSNSLKYTQEGGKITVATRKTDDSVFVSITDNGMGIPKDKQKQLFTKFFQVGQSLAKPIQAHRGTTSSNPQTSFGSGLGLYITKGIIDAHSGTIHVDSEEGKGTTVSFSIPFEFEQKQTAPTHPHDLQTSQNQTQEHTDLPRNPFGTTIH